MNQATIQTLNYPKTRGYNRRVKNFFYLDKPIEEFSTTDFLEIANKSLYRTIMAINEITGEKIYFSSNREARHFFDDKVNISDAIKYNWLVHKTYRIYNLDYAKLKDSPSLREQEP